MAYTPGETYNGLTLEDYNTLAALSTDIASYLNSNFSKVSGEDFYIFTGDTDEWNDMMMDIEAEEGVVVNFTQFLYLYSTWSVVGF